MTARLPSCPSLRWAAALLLTGAALTPATAATPESLDRELLKNAPEVVRHLRKKGHQNVGVLKFLVSTDGAKTTDNAGPLNARAARQLEIALQFAMTRDDEKNLHLIKNASSVAATLKGASFLDEKQRDKLFEPTYPLILGAPGQKVKADAFLTGLLNFEPGLRKVSVVVCLITPGKDMESVAQFTAAAAYDELIEGGLSFRTQGAGDGGSVIVQRVSKKNPGAVAVAQPDKAPEPPKVAPPPAKNELPVVEKVVPAAKLQDELATAPVGLEVRFNGRPVPVRFENGQYFVEEPEQGQKVELILIRKDNGTPDLYGAVVKVNGLSTFGKERGPVDQCRRWVLGKGAAPMVLQGFSMPDPAAGPDGIREEAFRVLSQKESAEQEVNYGEDAGQISFTIFKENLGKSKPPEPPAPVPLPETQVAAKDPFERKEQQQLALAAQVAVQTATLPEGPSQTTRDLAFKVFKLKTQGLIGEGGDVVSVEQVKRVAMQNPGVERSITIVYRPKLPPG